MITFWFSNSTHKTTLKRFSKKKTEIYCHFNGTNNILSLIKWNIKFFYPGPKCSYIPIIRSEVSLARYFKRNSRGFLSFTRDLRRSLFSAVNECRMVRLGACVPNNRILGFAVFPFVVIFSFCKSHEMWTKRRRGRTANPRELVIFTILFLSRAAMAVEKRKKKENIIRYCASSKQHSEVNRPRINVGRWYTFCSIGAAYTV